MKQKIKEVIVVEGRDDTKRLQEAFGEIDTIETHGSAIDETILEEIALAQAKRGVIVLTDPDFPGEKIRKIISQNVPGVKHVFISPTVAKPGKKGSLGVEHTSAADLRAALAHVYTQVDAAESQISQQELLSANLVAGTDARQRREQLGEILHIGYTNGKQLAKRLQLFEISPEEFQAAVRQLNTSATKR